MHHKESRFRKTLFAIIFSVSLTFYPVQVHHADAWMTIIGVNLKQMLEYLSDQIKGIILGAMKQAAISMLNKSISNMVAGNSTQESKIISNYQDFLYTQPQGKAKLFINDYISQTTGGQSSSNYVSNEGFNNPASGGAAYKTQLGTTAKSNITTQDKTAQISYVGDPGQNMFTNKNMDNFNSYISGINNPWAYNIYIEQKYKEKLAKEQDAARTKALAGQGFDGTEKNGQIVTPGSLIASQMAGVQNLGFQVIGGANSVPEVLQGVVLQIVSQTIKNGIGNAQQNITKQINNLTNSTDAQTQSGGPGAQYGNPGTKTTSTYIDPDTGKPISTQ